MPAPDETEATTVRRWWSAVGLVTLIGLGVRIAYVLLARADVDVAGDALYYHVAGNLLADGKGFVHPYGALVGVDVPGADHPPLYIVYLGLASLLGVRSATGHLLASAVLGAAAIPLAAAVGRRLGSRVIDHARGGRGVGLVAAALVAVYPNTWRYDGALMSETIVIVTVLFVLLAAFRYLDGPSPVRMAVVGLALGLAALARSELVLLALILVPLLAIARPWTSGEGRARHALVAAATGGLVALLVIAPWPVYNLGRFDTPVLFTTNAGGTFAVANCDRVYSGPNIGYWSYDCGADVLARDGIDPLRQGGEADEVLRKEGLTYIRQHLRRVPLVAAARFGRITGLYAPFQQSNVDVDVELDVSRPVATAGVWSYWVVAAFAIVGGVLGRRERLRLTVLLAPVAVVIVASVAFYAATRFRASAEPSLCILAAVAVVAGYDRWRARQAQPPVDDVVDEEDEVVAAD